MLFQQIRHVGVDPYATTYASTATHLLNFQTLLGETWSYVSNNVGNPSKIFLEENIYLSREKETQSKNHLN